jgi:hypothetical protein
MSSPHCGSHLRCREARRMTALEKRQRLANALDSIETFVFIKTPDGG